MKKLVLLALAALMLVGAACSSGDDAADIANATTPTTAGPAGPVTGTIVVSAATSLTQAFEQIAVKFERVNPGADVQLNFGASSALAEQIVTGAPADVFASADETSMNKLAAADRIDESAQFAQNVLTIVTKPDNPATVDSLADLATAGVISLCEAEVPCGKYAAEALENAGVVIEESKVTRGQNAAATLAAVADGDATAGIVYVTDAKDNAKVATIAIPAAQNVVATYPIAALAKSGDLTVAEAFIEFVRGAIGQQVLASFGFLPA